MKQSTTEYAVGDWVTYHKGGGVHRGRIESFYDKYGTPWIVLDSGMYILSDWIISKEA